MENPHHAHTGDNVGHDTIRTAAQNEEGTEIKI